MKKSGPKSISTESLTFDSGRFRREQLKAVSFAEATFSPHPYIGRAHRTWSRRALQEIVLGTGWNSFAGEILATFPRHITMPELDGLFWTAFPMINAAPGYRLGYCRLYPARIVMPNCSKIHRCAVLDIQTESNYNRVKAATKRRKRPRSFELILEERCECFYDGTREHEGSLSFWEI